MRVHTLRLACINTNVKISFRGNGSITLVGLAFEISALLKLKVSTCWVLLALGTLQTGVHSGSAWASDSVLTACHHDVVVSVSRKSHGTDKVEEVV